MFCLVTHQIARTHMIVTLTLLLNHLLLGEACVNSSGLEEVDGRELETDVISSPLLECEVIF